MATADDADDAALPAHVPQQRGTPQVGIPVGAAVTSGSPEAVSPEAIEAKVTSLLAGLRLPPAAAGRLVVAVWEAVTNAMVHGRTPAPAVGIHLSPAGDEVIATVTDHGPGFDPGEVSDPLAPPRRLRPGGRGLLLISRYTDSVDYFFPLHGGTVVTLHAGIPA
ncbi:ATP-binding protein [Actinomadura napierensis]|uniref:Histidine kinase/HSP90-like ATPase domain-containing protein n=1 Tax=Actinomadura napierensis TaxID=267854 RepID=A0ABP5K9U4_9ACTN